MAKIDLMSKPVAIEVYQGAGGSYIYVDARGPERKEISEMGFSETIDYVIENCEDTKTKEAIKKSLIQTRSTNIVVYSVNKLRYGSGVKYSNREEIPNYDDEPINNSKHFELQKDDTDNEYWLCQIRVFDTGIDIDGAKDKHHTSIDDTLKLR